ncbi:MAG: flagellar protein export ATPase FliI [Spirochaetales bacterium]|nr:flagellar protein export ATPase FliI [Spirochaetales bacterium]
MLEIFDKYFTTLKKLEPVKFTGSVTGIHGMVIESNGPQAVIGELCYITIENSERLWCEVVALKGTKVQLMPFGEMDGVKIGSLVTASGETLHVNVSNDMLGRVLDGLGRPTDGKGAIVNGTRYPAMRRPPDAMRRKRIEDRLVTGVKAIDGLIPLGKGQRVGIFAGSGVGKSTLMGMIARNTNADINVIALIGERGREVLEFLENDLGEEGLKRSVVIVATGDTPPLARLKGAFVATAVAEFFRDQGKDVMLLFDSVTRFAMAQREIGLSTGEPPATRGYTPSVFTMLPKLLERAGTNERGSITGIYTILVEGDDMDEPISDAVRGILDGHIVLSRDLAHKFHYPAVDVLQSVSRLTNKITSKPVQQNIGYIRKMLALYKDKEDLINIGAYTKGSNPELDEAIDKIKDINNFLKQDVDEEASIKDTLNQQGLITGQFFDGDA